MNVNERTNERHKVLHRTVSPDAFILRRRKTGGTINTPQSRPHHHYHHHHHFTADEQRQRTTTTVHYIDPIAIGACPALRHAQTRDMDTHDPGLQHRPSSEVLMQNTVRSVRTLVKLHSTYPKRYDKDDDEASKHAAHNLQMPREETAAAAAAAPSRSLSPTAGPLLPRSPFTNCQMFHPLTPLN